MPNRKTIDKAREDAREGKSASTQAGEFVREEMHHVRQGRHGARSPQQAVAIGLSKARRAGVDLPPPGKGKATSRTRHSAQYAYAAGRASPAPSRACCAVNRGARRHPVRYRSRRAEPRRTGAAHRGLRLRAKPHAPRVRVAVRRRRARLPGRGGSARLSSARPRTPPSSVSLRRGTVQASHPVRWRVRLIAIEAAPRGVGNEAVNTDGNREHEKQSGHAP